MAKSLWIKPKHGGHHKEELSPITIVVAGAFLAFGFSAYFLYHIRKEPKESPVVESKAPPPVFTRYELQEFSSRVQKEEQKMTDRSGIFSEKQISTFQKQVEAETKQGERKPIFSEAELKALEEQTKLTP